MSSDNPRHQIATRKIFESPQKSRFGPGVVTRRWSPRLQKTEQSNAQLCGWRRLEIFDFSPLHLTLSMHLLNLPRYTKDITDIVLPAAFQRDKIRNKVVGRCDTLTLLVGRFYLFHEDLQHKIIDTLLAHRSHMPVTRHEQQIFYSLLN